MTQNGKWSREVHEKARLLHKQLAALHSRSDDSTESTGLMTVLAEPYLRLLDELFTDELPWAQAMDNSDLVVRLKGPAANEVAPRVKLIADTFDNVREQIHRIAKAVAGLTDVGGKVSPDLDLGLSGFARGSVIIGLKVRGPEASAQMSVLSDDDPLLLATREAVRHLGEIPRYVRNDGIDAAFGELFSDPGVRDTVVAAAAKIAPSGQRGIDAIELTVPDNPSPLQAITPKSRTVLRQALARPVRLHSTGEFLGVVRELDLDLKRFELRRMTGYPSLRCAYLDLPDERATSLLNATVKVSGPVEYGANNVPRLLEVQNLEIVEPPPQQITLRLSIGNDPTE